MAVNNSLATKTTTQVQKKETFTSYLSKEGVKKQIASILGGKRGISFTASLVSAYQANPALQECTYGSILSAALLGESLNLSPSSSLGQFWMIPYNNTKKGCKEASFQIGANGYKQLAMRTGQYRDLDFIEVREGEYLGRDEVTGKRLFRFISDDEQREALPVVGYLAYFELTNGFRKSMYWSVSQMEAHADQYSNAFSIDAYRKLQNGEIPEKDMWKYSSYWYSNFSGMAEKTLIKNLLKKWGILSTELQQAIDADMAVINEDGTKIYVDNDEDHSIVADAEAKVVEPEPKDEPMNPPVETEEMNAVQQELFN